MTEDVNGSMLAPLVGVDPLRPSAVATDIRLTVNVAAKRGVSSAIIGTMNVYTHSIEY